MGGGSSFLKDTGAFIANPLAGSASTAKSLFDFGSGDTTAKKYFGLEGPEIPRGNADKTLAAIAAALFEQTQGARTGLANRWDDILSGNYDMPSYLSPARDAIETQFSGARDSIIGATPAGGGLTAALAGLERDRSGSIGNLISGDIQTQLANAFGASFGSAPNQAMTGLSSVAASDMQRQMAEANAQMAKGQGLGQLAGKLGSAAIMA